MSHLTFTVDIVLLVLFTFYEHKNDLLVFVLHSDALQWNGWRRESKTDRMFNVFGILKHVLHTFEVINRGRRNNF